MPEISKYGFSSEFFMSRGHSYLWQPSLLWLEVMSNALLALALAGMAWSIRRSVSGRHEAPSRTAWSCVALSLASCSMTHLLDVWLIWKPDYWLNAAVRGVAAACTVAAALLLPSGFRARQR